MKLLSSFGLLTMGLLLAPHSAAHAQWDDGYWLLKFEDTTGAALQPLHIGIDPGDGSGFSFLTLPDDDGDGVIHLPRVPNGRGLALGVDVDGEVGCDIWDIIGTQVVVPPAAISHPLLMIADDVEGTALGMDFIPYPQVPFPSLRALMPGERLTATDGQLTDWPGLHLATVGHAAINFLDEYVEQVGTLPNFTGEVIVTDFLLTGTFVPEPGAAVLFGIGALGLLPPTVVIRRRNTQLPQRALDRPTAAILRLGDHGVYLALQLPRQLPVIL